MYILCTDYLHFIFIASEGQASAASTINSNSFGGVFFLLNRAVFPSIIKLFVVPAQAPHPVQRLELICAFLNAQVSGPVFFVEANGMCEY